MSLTMPAELPGNDEWQRRRRARSLAIALGLGALVVIFYVATLVRLGPNAIRKESYGTSPQKTLPADDPAICRKAGTC